MNHPCPFPIPWCLATLHSMQRLLYIESQHRLVCLALPVNELCSSCLGCLAQCIFETQLCCCVISGCFLWMLRSIPLPRCSTFCLFIHQLMGILVASNLGKLVKELLWTFENNLFHTLRTYFNACYFANGHCHALGRSPYATKKRRPESTGRAQELWKTDIGSTITQTKRMEK